MEMFQQLMLASGLAWASGMRLYAVALVLGVLAHWQIVTLPGQLSLLGHPYVLIASGVLCACEFIADKVPAFDSFWDALHTFIRGPGGATLAAMAVAGGGDSQVTQVIAALLGGTLATGTHLAKAGTRVMINHSPEPVSNWTASASEDVTSLGIIWLAWQHPWLFCGALLLFLLLLAWALPKLWRYIRTLFRKLTAQAQKTNLSS
jgi:hypothetical protein